MTVGPFSMNSDDDECMIINWFTWPSWFKSNTGVGNSLGMWWPSRQGKHSAWILCDRCGLPFEMPTGFFMASMNAASTRKMEDEDLEWTGGPCTRCKEEDGVIATGTPILTMVTNGQGMATIAGSQAVAAMSLEWWSELTDDLLSGGSSVQDVARRLKGGGAPLSRLADWFESRPVTTAAAGAIMVSLIGVIGPQLLARPETGATYDKKIVNIIDTVLDHYDSVHPAKPDGADAPVTKKGSKDER